MRKLYNRVSEGPHRWVRYRLDYIMHVLVQFLVRVLQDFWKIKPPHLGVKLLRSYCIRDSAPYIMKARD